MRIEAETSVAIHLNNREAKMLTCLIGALSANQMKDFIEKAYRFESLLGNLYSGEVDRFSQSLYDGLSDSMGL